MCAEPSTIRTRDERAPFPISPRGRRRDLEDKLKSLCEDLVTVALCQTLSAFALYIYSADADIVEVHGRMRTVNVRLCGR